MDLVAIAIIKRAVGLDGCCGVAPYGETFERLKAPVAVYIGEDGRSAFETVLEEKTLRPQGWAVVLRDVAGRTAAERIQGQNIYIREDHLPKLGDGQYYHFHLKGMAVVGQSSGEKIGTVRDAVNLPSMDGLDVALLNGHEVIIPYNDQAVVSVDGEKKVIVVSDSYLEELL
ncbi:MAG: ribosome maturation factor RimM [Chitinispirillia bacterium]|nr:ribosome maturation factor RimM [Chitinispirillia bacterium]MCL2241398.1 ribosome maturation factor RimM [Chitinispirillia bacterium]